MKKFPAQKDFLPFLRKRRSVRFDMEGLHNCVFGRFIRQKYKEGGIGVESWWYEDGVLSLDTPKWALEILQSIFKYCETNKVHSVSGAQILKILNK